MTESKLANRSTVVLARDLPEARELAKIIAGSGLVPKDYVDKPDAVFVAIQMGAELGLAPMQSLQNIAVINGRPSVWGDAMLALVQVHPDCQDIAETFDADKMVATCTVKRRSRTPVVRSFSKQDAMAATLWGKAGPWKQYPKRMLQMRARGFALRDSFADALKGLISAEEAGDIPIDVEGETIQDRIHDTGAVGNAADHVEPEPPEASFWPNDTYQFGKGEGKKLSEGSDEWLQHYTEALAKRVDGGQKYRPAHLKACHDEISIREQMKAQAAPVETAKEADKGQEATKGPGEGLTSGEAVKKATSAFLLETRAVLAGNMTNGIEEEEDRDLLKTIDAELESRKEKEGE